MKPCTHPNLLLLEERDSSLLCCRHCHLTIREEELNAGHCPECAETRGKRHREFDKVKKKSTGGTRYRCEDCGEIIQCDTSRND